MLTVPGCVPLRHSLLTNRGFNTVKGKQQWHWIFRVKFLSPTLLVFFCYCLQWPGFSTHQTRLCRLLKPPLLFCFSTDLNYQNRSELVDSRPIFWLFFRPKYTEKLIIVIRRRVLRVVLSFLVFLGMFHHFFMSIVMATSLWSRLPR